MAKPRVMIDDRWARIQRRQNMRLALAASEAREHATEIDPDIWNSLTQGYKRLATDARYRPTVPGVFDREVDLSNQTLADHRRREKEALCYAAEHWREARYGEFRVTGWPDAEDVQAFIFVLEAARMMCRASPIARHKWVVKLLQMAITEITEAHTMIDSQNIIDALPGLYNFELAGIEDRCREMLDKANYFSDEE